MGESQKVMYVSVEPKEVYYCIGINYRQWKQLQKKIEKQFNNDYGSFSEVRIYKEDDDTIEVEGHGILDRKRK